MKPQDTEADILGERAVIIGAGMAGLLAAAAISRYFRTVDIIARDTLPSQPGLRRGVPQAAHVHTLLGYGVAAFDQLLPGLVDQLYAKGAVKIRRNLDIWFHDTMGPTQIRDINIPTPSLTRPLLEHLTR